MFFPYVLHPRSKGTVKLRSSDPSDPPIINPNYYGDPSDVKTMIAAVRTSMSIGSSDHFKKYGAKFYSRPSPFCKHLQMYARTSFMFRPTFFSFLPQHFLGTLSFLLGTAMNTGNVPSDTLYFPAITTAVHAGWVLKMI